MEPKLKKELQKILTALAIFFAMMVVDKTGLCPLIFAHRLPSLFAYLIPYLLCGYDVVRKALLGIRNRQPMDESLLMFVATIGAFATGENSEAVAVMAFYLESPARTLRVSWISFRRRPMLSARTGPSRRWILTTSRSAISS